MMRFVTLIMLLVFSFTPALATPPDLTCSGGGENERVHFRIPLITGHSSIYPNGVMPLSAHHIIVTFGTPGSHENVEYYSEHMVAQWLLDGRVDMRLYAESQGSDSFVSYDLIIRTARTGETSLESGHFLHRGIYEFVVSVGVTSTGAVERIEEIEGVADCS